MYSKDEKVEMVPITGKLENMALYNVIKMKPHIPYFVASLQYSNKLLKEQEYRKCYQILEISENSDQEEIRRAYLMLVKRFHPDSCTEEADADKFQEIDKAFKILMDKKSKERWNVDDVADDVEEQDINHTAPQHRQYLSYGGMGYGNPFQREKQYTKIRALQASENVMKHRLAKATADEKSLMAKVPYKHKIKTKYGFDRLVEDLIQEAMSKGEFNNLSGSGKPLSDIHSKNPYVDYVTHKLNEVLIENGFTPEWITLQKEIREEIQVFRNALYLERINFSPYPLSVEENIKWSNAVYKHKEVADQLNRKINKYNLLVPILQRQMFFLSFPKEAQNVLLKGKTNKDVIHGHTVEANKANIETATKESTNLFGFLQILFRKS